VAEYLYDLRLPEAPYRFVWATEAAVDCKVTETAHYSERRYTHVDQSEVVIRQYHVDRSFRVMTNRGEIKLIDNAQDPRSPDPVSIVYLP
jgi:hypothetical protein